ALPGFAAAEEGLPRPVDHVHLDTVGYGIETQDRVGRPVDAGDARVVEGHAFVERPARRLQDRAFRLVGDPVRVDRLPAVDRRDRAHEARPAGLAIDLRL